MQRTASSRAGAWAQWDEVGAIGLGCWAIGGPVWRGKDPSGWGEVDDAESVRAVQRGVEPVAQVEDNAGALRTGALAVDEMEAIAAILVTA